ncbi:MAG: 30S ribosomal protein S17 [Kiritimatiellia bacterium]|jgi:small subunit ribosomal protein S17
MAETEVKSRGSRKVRTGVVVRRSGDKTVLVKSERRKPHPLYGKVVKIEKAYHVHDEENRAQVGDRVTIVECRPLSRTKRWRLAPTEGEQKA